jgi:uncharacterized RDD family membrane protein YckC
MTKINDIKSKYEYASLNRKIIAFGIDVVIITLVLSPIMNLLMMIFFGFDTNSYPIHVLFFSPPDNPFTKLPPNFVF